MECFRCGREFESSIPKVTEVKGVKEIMCSDWCAACNAYVLSIVYRGRSAYTLKPIPQDPIHDSPRMVEVGLIMEASRRRIAEVGMDKYVEELLIQKGGLL